MIGMRVFVAFSAVCLCGCTAIGDQQTQTIYVPTSRGVEAQTVSTGPARETDSPASEQEIDEPAIPGSASGNLKELLTRLVVLTDFCWNEANAYLDQEFGSPFRRAYLQNHGPLQTRRSPLFNVHIQMACLFGAEVPSGVPPLSAEQTRLVGLFMRAMSGQDAPAAGLLADMRQYAERTESGEIAKSYLTDINQELFGVGIFSRPSHGLDSCGTRYCRPLFHMCDPRTLREFREESLAASFERICHLRDQLEARR